MNVQPHITGGQPFEEDLELFERANLYPRDTGLPMTVWVGPGGRAQHDVRVKVCRSHGDRINADDTATVGVRPTPSLIDGPLSSADLKLVSAWIVVNTEALVGYWDGSLSTLELAQRLQPV